jgi:hypothetical protein
MSEELNGIRIDTNYHSKIENNPFYKKLKELFFNTVAEHTCAADEGQNYDEKTDGLYVSGKEEAAYFIATWAFENFKHAWELGWRSREQACGKSRLQILVKKKFDWDSFKAAIIFQIDSLNPPAPPSPLNPLP